VAGLTSRFVSVPSVNGEHPELDLAMVIAAELEAAGYQTTLVGSENRPSLAGIGGGDPTVLLSGHLDTVPVDDAEQWRYPPFEGVIADGAVHGRGACDMKGGLAVQVAVAQWLASQGLGDGLVLHFAMGEERGEPGTEDLIAAGFIAPLGIVLEPTDLRLGIAQRGLVTIRIRIEGRSGHASRPDLADNPIDRLPRVLRTIADLEAEPSSRHDLLGAPAWTPTMVRSGVIPSMVPGGCELWIDRRMLPGETVDSVLATLERALAEELPDTGFSITVAEEEGIYAPAEVRADSPTVTLMSRSLQVFGEEADLFGTPYSSDVRHLINKAGIEAVTYGPGRPSAMHARDESIAVDDLLRAARVVAAFSLMALSGAGDHEEVS
jgi:succinyl-diaminopimelate desuccinylase